MTFNTFPLYIPVNRTVKNLIKRALKEDLGRQGDITTLATIPLESESEAIIMSKAAGIVAGQKLGEAVFKHLDSETDWKILKGDGSKVDSGEVITRIKGLTRAILIGERTALNLMARVSGIATLTHSFVKEVSGTNVIISETRKTAPGLRYLDKWAVRIGGGVNHRQGLYDAFLIKENHISAVGNLQEAIKRCYLWKSKIKGKNCPIIVEVRSVSEFLQAQEAGAERILLDNMNLEEIAQCVELKRKGVLIEVSGGINLSNVKSFAQTGVDIISVGALTHSPKALDLSLLITKTEPIKWKKNRRVSPYVKGE